MTSKARNILIVAGIAIAATLGIIGYAAYSLYSFFDGMADFRKVPDELKDPRVLKGEGFLRKSEMFKLTNDGILGAISKGMSKSDERERQKVVSAETAKSIFNFSDLEVVGNEIIAVGKFGAFVFDLDGNLKRQILFEVVKENVKIGPFETNTYQSDLDNLRIAKLDNERFGFLSWGSMEGVRVFDDTGKEIWSYDRQNVHLDNLLKDEKERNEDYKKSTYVMEVAVGDLDGDGVSEYIVARKSDGIHAFDRQGNEKWFQPDDFPNSPIEIADLDGDEKNEILQGSKVRDGNGNLLRELKGGLYDEISSAALFARNKNGQLSIQSCHIYLSKLVCWDENKETLLSGEAPLSEVKEDPKRIDIPDHPESSFTSDTQSVAHPKAVWISLDPNKPKYLAIVAAYIGPPRGNLYVYEPNGNLVFHELLGEDAETIAVLPGHDGNEELLVGGKNTIWKYSLN